MNSIKEQINFNMEWHHSNVMPTESGLYLVIIGKEEYKILPFFKKGDVIDESPINDRTAKEYGFVRKCIATEDNFYEESDNGLIVKAAFIFAWAKLPDDTNEILNLFVRKGEE